MQRPTLLRYCCCPAVAFVLVCQPVLGQQSQTFVAYSMKVAQSRIEEAARRGQDFRKTQPDVYYLARLTKPFAVVIDRERGDTILIGEANADCEILTLDDWVAALRARYYHPDENPGVTIDPLACDRCRSGNAPCRHTVRQDVRFFAGISNTRFGQVCFQSDWLMKEIGFDRNKPPVPGLEGYSERLGREMHRNKVSQLASRFWLEPVGMTRVYPDVIMLEPMHIRVFTEVLFAEANGRILPDPNSYHFAPHDDFAHWFTDKYHEIARYRPQLRTLLGLTELAALAKSLRRIQDARSLEFFLKRYPKEKVETPSEVDSIREYNRRWQIQRSGGAELMALVMQVKKGNARALSKMVLTARERVGHEKVAWEVNLVIKDGRLVGATYDPGYQVDPEEVAPWFARATFLLRKRNYDAAIDYYTKVLERVPDNVDALCDRGVAYRLKGQSDLAESDYRRALKVEPRCGRACNNLGVLLLQKGKRSEAEDRFRRAVEVIPFYGSPHNNLAICLRIAGELDAATAEYREAILLNPGDVFPRYNLGLCLLLAGEVEEAARVLDEAVELRPEHHPPVYFHAGVAMYEARKLKAAERAFKEYVRLKETSIKTRGPHFGRFENATVVSTSLCDEQGAADLARQPGIDPATWYLRLIGAQLRVPK